MSNSRPFRRLAKPPDHVLDAFAQQQCPDCDSELTVYRRDGIWQCSVAHDDGCPQLAWRERHGATSSVLLAAEPGKAVTPDAVKVVTDALLDRPGVVGVRVSDHSSLSWQERQQIDEANS